MTKFHVAIRDDATLCCHVDSQAARVPLVGAVRVCAVLTAMQNEKENQQLIIAGPLADFGVDSPQHTLTFQLPGGF